MLSRQGKRRLKAVAALLVLALGATLFLRHRGRPSRAAYDDGGDGNMFSAAVKQATKRKASVPYGADGVRLRTEGFDMPDIDIQRAENILLAAEKYRREREDLAGAPLAEAVEAAEPAHEAPDGVAVLLREITSMLKTNEDRIADIQTHIERMNKRLQSQEDTAIELENVVKSRMNIIAEKQSDILKQTSAITKKSEMPFSRVVKFAEAPISTVNCFGNSTLDRVCRVKNLCYDPPTDKFFVFKDPSSLEVNTPKNRSYLVDMTSIDGHNRFFFDYQEVHPDRFEQRSFRLVEKLTFMISRFHVFNIMHSFHDDFIGLYLLHRMFAPNTDDDPSFSFTQDNNIVFADSWTNLRFDYVFQLLSSNQLQFREQFKKDRSNTMPICFRDAVIGNSKLGSWYTYGFLEPQGPIANKTVSGLLVREVASYLMKRFHLPAWNENSIRGIVGDLKALTEVRRRKGVRENLFKNISDHHYITIFSRKLDRLIVNEEALAERLQKIYGLEVRYVRIENMHLMEQISILKNTVIAMGMHGSALILSMFLPPGALLVEFFPYRVPADNYTPYKTLCNLPGIRMAYRAWTNTHPENNIPHPEKPANGGGIKHLNETMQQAILESDTVPPHLCCSDPAWLFRIYQDTTVHIEEVFDLIDDGIMDAYQQITSDPADWVYIRPASIENMYCKVASSSEDPEQLDLSISWTKPWNGVRPDFYGIWVHQLYTEVTSNTTEHVFAGCKAGMEYDLWVRPYTVDPITKEVFKGSYSDKFSCVCALDTKAVKGKIDL